MAALESRINQPPELSNSFLLKEMLSNWQQIAKNVPHAVLKALRELPDNFHFKDIKITPLIITMCLAAFYLTSCAKSEFQPAPSATMIPPPSFTVTPAPDNLLPTATSISVPPPTEQLPAAVDKQKRGQIGINIDFNKGEWWQFVIPGMPLKMTIVWDGEKWWDHPWIKNQQERINTYKPAILGFSGTPPEKRREIEGILAPPCALPDPAYYGDFADFINATLDRFPDTQYVEIWNEPDAPQYPYKDTAWPTIGCEMSGKEYAQMLKVIYPEIKIRHPAVTVLAGALSDGMGEFAREFIPNARDEHGGYFYDGISFHSYPAFPGDFNEILEEAEFLGAIASSATDLYATETSLICDISEYDCDSEEFKQAQLKYLKFLIKHRNQFRIILWYTLANNDWAFAELVRDNQVQKTWCLLYRRGVGEQSPLCPPH